MPSTHLIIFDCDGVLVDSEPISVAVLLDMIVAAGGAISEDDAYRLFLGRSMASIMVTLRDDFGLAVTPDHLAVMRAEIHARFRRDLQPVPGVAAILPLVGRRCVASSSQPERIRLSLELTGLLAFLEPHIFSASMVEHGKPAPDLFLHAAKNMGVGPAHCVVIEDSPAGVEAAKRAGMRVFGFTGGSHAARGALRQALAPLEPDIMFDDMLQLPSLLAGLEAREKRR